MEGKRENYFAIGEFAALFGLSKQTLFYYEKSNLLVPALVDEENGYRYYSLEQYFEFEIIINLRKLGVPLKVISGYLQNRSIEALQKIYRDKQAEYKLQIDILQRNSNNLQTKINRLEKAKNIKMDRITLEECPEEYLVCTPFEANGNLKEGVTTVSKHNYSFFTSEILNEYLMGYFIPKDKLLSGEHKAITQIFTRVSYPDEYPGQITIKPEGLYAIIYTVHGFHVEFERNIKKLFEFIERNGLTVTGDLYVDQLRNYWSTTKYNEYISKLSIGVDYL